MLSRVQPRLHHLLRSRVAASALSVPSSASWRVPAPSAVGRRRMLSTPSVQKASDEIEVYKKSQAASIRTYMGVAIFNFMFFSADSLIHFALKDKLPELPSLEVFGAWADAVAGSPFLLTFGLTASVLLLYLSHRFAQSAVYRAYFTPDMKRIGFQVHTMTGFPGRKFEVSLGDANFLSHAQQAELLNATAPFQSSSGFFGRGLTPIQVKGVKGNLLIDKVALDPNDKRFLEALALDRSMALAAAKERRSKSKK